MRYEVRCLTPTLVGDGSVLSPIDYMVWRGQINILDQQRIFRLLAKSPRLETYLREIKKATKLEFAAWGGFAQNFALRRTSFDDPAYADLYAALPPEQLHIPTFIRDHRGPYLPGSALKGALRTAVVASLFGGQLAESAANLPSKLHQSSRWGQAAEDQVLGANGTNLFRMFRVSDSQPVEDSSLRIFLTRVAVLARAASGGWAVRWKVAGKNQTDADNPREGTVTFAEMAAPGTAFSGEAAFSPQLARQEQGGEEPLTLERMLEAVNDWAARLLEVQWGYARAAGLNRLAGTVESLRLKVEEARKARACVVCLGWGTGYLAKTGLADIRTEQSRNLIQQVPAYSRVLKTGLPFPKTRRLIFAGEEPASLPGWVWVSFH